MVAAARVHLAGFAVALELNGHASLHMGDWDPLAMMLGLWEEFALRNGVIISDTDASPRLPF